MERTLRALVAEDNEVNQVVIRGMLEYAGFEVDTVSNGNLAIEALEAARYDMIVMDCLMPILNGYETTRQIRAASPARFDPEIPILAITALASAQDRWKCLDAGMSGFITKPVEAHLLYSWIRKNICADLDPEMRRRQKSNVDKRQPESPHELSQSELRSKMAPIFIRDASQWQLDLSEQLEAGGIKQLQDLAHKIRGTADILGYDSLSQIAAKLEKFELASTGDEIKTLVDSLQELLKELVQEIKDGHVVGC